MNNTDKQYYKLTMTIVGDTGKERKIQIAPNPFVLDGETQIEVLHKVVSVAAQALVSLSPDYSLLTHESAIQSLIRELKQS